MKYWWHVIGVSIKNPLTFIVPSLTIKEFLIFIMFFYVSEPLYNLLWNWSGWEVYQAQIKTLWISLKALGNTSLIFSFLDFCWFLYLYRRRNKLAQFLSKIIEDRKCSGGPNQGFVCKDDPCFEEIITRMKESKLCSAEVMADFKDVEYRILRSFKSHLHREEARYLILLDELNHINKDLRR